MKTIEQRASNLAQQIAMFHPDQQPFVIEKVHQCHKQVLAERYPTLTASEIDSHVEKFAQELVEQMAKIADAPERVN
jgi:hypothetical protein